jgi:uncharacterized protein YjaZ
VNVFRFGGFVRFINLILIGAFGSLVGCASNTSVKREADVVTFYSNDLKNFWEAFDKAAGADIEGCAKIFDEIYFKKGSQGLKDFYKVRLRDSKNLCNSVIALRPYYEKTRELMPNLEKFNEPILKSFTDLKKIYPNTTNVETYYLIGATTTAGTTRSNRLLIGLEMFTSYDSGVDTKIVPKHLLPYRMNFSMVPAVAVHELIHTQQLVPDPEPTTLLENTLIEGVADFLTRKLNKTTMNDHLFTHGVRNEKTLKKLFAKKMNGTDLSDFLYNSSTSKHPDMGYFIGYRIAESYFEKMEDKNQAVDDMLNIKDFKGFLAKSGYLTNLK